MIVIQDPHQAVTLLSRVGQLPVVLYIGPDQIMPLTSVLGALVGVALMFWTRLLGLAHKFRGMVTRRASAPQDSTTK
jgi:hypothetical protein